MNKLFENTTYRQAALLYDSTWTASIATLINAGILAFVQWSVFNHEHIVIWLVYMLLITVFRNVISQRFYRQSADAINVPIWILYFYIGSTASGIGWGIAATLPFPESHVAHHVFLAFIIGGMAAGAVTSLSAVFLVSVTFLVVLLIPLATRLFVTGDDLLIVMGIMTIVFMTILIGNARRIANNIAEIIQAHQDTEAREKELKSYKTTLDQTQDCIFTFDPVSLRFIYVNHGAVEQVGYSFDELKNMTPLDIKPEFTEKEYRQLIKPILDGEKEVVHIETVHKHKSGALIPVEVILQYVHPSGEIPRFIAVVRDITNRRADETERHKLQQQLLQAQKMESIGHLTGGIAHDFNNILGVITGYAELLQLDKSKGPDRLEKEKEYLNEILTAGSRAKELIAKMLTYSRLQSTDKEVPVTLVKPIVKEVIYLLRASIPSTMNTNYQIDDDNLRLSIQPVQLHQILMNLSINARDAIDEYGNIDIIISNSHSEGTCQSCYKSFNDNYTKITVSDNGKGISESLLLKIFDPFYSNKGVGKGTGMGLSVVHGIVHDLGGHITVSSQVGSGTAISLLLPPAQVVIEADNIIIPVTSTYGNFLSGLRIMVVDDEKSITKILQRILTKHGAQTVVFTSSEQALSVFMQNPDNIDLLITDQTMPKLSGFDMSKTVLEKRPDLPVILCTGFSEHVNEESAKQSGILGFINKPFKINELLYTLKLICTERNIPAK